MKSRGLTFRIVSTMNRKMNELLPLWHMSCKVKYLRSKPFEIEYIIVDFDGKQTYIINPAYETYLSLLSIHFSILHNISLVSIDIRIVPFL